MLSHCEIKRASTTKRICHFICIQKEDKEDAWLEEIKALAKETWLENFDVVEHEMHIINTLVDANVWCNMVFFFCLLNWNLNLKSAQLIIEELWLHGYRACRYRWHFANLGTNDYHSFRTIIMLCLLNHKLRMKMSVTEAKCLFTKIWGWSIVKRLFDEKLGVT